MTTLAIYGILDQNTVMGMDREFRTSIGSENRA